MKILIAEKNEMMRQVIKRILNAEFLNVECVETDDTHSIIAFASSADFDIIIADISESFYTPAAFAQSDQRAQKDLLLIYTSIYAEDASRIIQTNHQSTFLLKENYIELPILIKNYCCQ